MFKIEAEKETLIVMLNKAMAQKLACQLIIGELEDVTRPGRIVQVTETHLQFEELYFGSILTFALSDVNGISERSPKNGKSVLLENYLPEVSKFSDFSSRRMG